MAPRSTTLPFILHLVVEAPACLAFFSAPDAQLSSPAPQAHAVIRQYAALLLSTNLVAAVFAFSRTDPATARLVAGALAVYHVAPMVRASSRIARSAANVKEPLLHLVAHTVCLVALAGDLLTFGAPRVS